MRKGKKKQNWDRQQKLIQLLVQTSSLVQKIQDLNSEAQISIKLYLNNIVNQRREF